jgi:hypothetical protein
MKLQLTLLQFLRAAGGELLTPETQLRNDARLAVSPPPTGLEISEALNDLERRGYAVSVRDGLTEIVRWQITDLGRVQLTTRHL